MMVAATLRVLRAGACFMVLTGCLAAPTQQTSPPEQAVTLGSLADSDTSECPGAAVVLLDRGAFVTLNYQQRQALREAAAAASERAAQTAISACSSGDVEAATTILLDDRENRLILAATEGVPGRIGDSMEKAISYHRIYEVFSNAPNACRSVAPEFGALAFRYYQAAEEIAGDPWQRSHIYANLAALSQRLELPVGSRIYHLRAERCAAFARRSNAPQ
jgi:hypothetical protein